MGYVDHEAFIDRDSGEEVAKRVANEAYRALMAGIRVAISSNSCVGGLKTRPLIPMMVSTYSSESLHNFLRSVESSEMSIWGCDHGAGWVTNTGDGHLDGLQKLNRIFPPWSHVPVPLLKQVSMDGMVPVENVMHQ